MSSSHLTRPRISLDLLARMLERLTPEELALFPARKLPDQIPAEWLASLPPGQLARVRELLAERNVGQQQAPTTAANNRDDLLLMGAVRSSNDKRLPAALRILQRDVGDLADLIHRWRNNLHAAVEVRSLDTAIEFDLGERADPEPEAMPDRAGPVERKRAEISRLLRGMQADFQALFQGEWVLKARIASGADSDGRMARALRNLHDTIAPLEELLARYHTLGLTIAHHEMNEALEQVDRRAAERVEIEQRIQALRAQIRRSGTWLRNGPRNTERDRLENRIQALSQEAATTEHLIRREQLLHWLEAWVDASLDPTAPTLARRRLGEARNMLVRLIREFSSQTERRARDYSGRVAPAAPAQLLRSYFSTKSQAPNLHYAVNSEQVANTLLRLERELVEAMMSGPGAGR